MSRDNIRDARGNYWVPEQENYISDLEEFSVVCMMCNAIQSNPDMDDEAVYQLLKENL